MSHPRRNRWNSAAIRLHKGKQRQQEEEPNWQGASGFLPSQAGAVWLWISL
jgi:hypothetical protein